MAVFKLTEEAMSRLRAKFEEFQEEREALEELLADYVADYRQFKGSALARQERLAERYSGRAGKFSHLVWDEEGETYWSASDIAIVLGRDRSTITRTLEGMRDEEGWCGRLLALSKSARTENGLPVEVYGRGIFDLILDRYEEAYLLRFSRPRRGDPGKAPDIQEVRRFWDYLRASAQAQRECLVHQLRQEEVELPDVLPMGWGDVASLIWRKVFTVRTGIFLSILFALCFELVRRWPVLLPWPAAASAAVLLACAVLLRLRKGAASTLGSVGAGALLFVLLWGVGLLSSDGVIHAPSGAALDLRKSEQTLELHPRLGRGGAVNFEVTSTLYDNLKEIFYRVRPEAEYRSTGFNDLHYPLLLIEAPREEGSVTLDVKFVDAAGVERGPWTFSFDVGTERFALSKRFFLNQMDSWVSLIRIAGETRAEVDVETDFADDVVRTVVYGINAQPDVWFPIPKGGSATLLRERDDRVRYIMSYLVFDDGTSSDVRRTDLKRAPGE